MLQDDAPAALNVPAPHVWHAAEDVLPGVEANLPAVQLVHDAVLPAETDAP